MNEIIILDVGHGNAAILKSNGSTGIFDAAPGATLLDNLKAMDIEVIDHVFLSHADHDHVGGLTNLLLSSEVRIVNLHLNGDAQKQGPSYLDLMIAVDHSVAEKGTQIHFQYAGKNAVQVGNTQIKTLSPRPSTGLTGVGNRDLSGEKITSNNQSSMFLVSLEEENIIMFGGDADISGLTAARSLGLSLKTPILVYPHHGGHVGSGITDEDFANEICNAFLPDYILFSNGRRKHNNPLPEVVARIKQNIPNIKIICTQLSRTCSQHDIEADVLPEGYTDHLLGLPSASLSLNDFCAGTIRIEFTSGTLSLDNITKHTDFVGQFAPRSLCLRQ